ncbi:peptide chain release factor N(5)-glutamine methyltransferase [Aequorivita sp. Q41]|uniref:peptide chain release factor N(5)-glutamine methyltransferase n=1 Tax=Aequorivita sp. Q41 TaxID=3153300 RepID=UPI003241EFC7
MTLKELKAHFTNSLSDLYPSEEIQSFFTILSENYLQLSRIEIALNPAKEISLETKTIFQKALLQLLNNEPIQYILGETEFYGLPFKVNKHTLIPRPETEELVEWILSEVKNIQGIEGEFNILDIGTGSGCIAISLAKNLPTSIVSAIDFSKEALKVACQNANDNQVEVHFFQADILKTAQLPKQYDLIVSNPPYVREMEKKMMQQNVLKYEPDSALFVSDADPLLFYRVISQLAKKHLKPNGNLFFEINEYLSEELRVFLKEEGFQNIEVKKDIFRKNRMIKCNLHERP